MNFFNTDITKIKSDCIINPSNGLGVMHKGVSRIIHREGGPEVLNSSKEACFYHGLYKPGEAYLGKAGFLEKRGFKAIIHAVTIYRHPQKSKIEDIPTAIENSIKIIREQGFESFSIPSIGIEPRNINERLSAETIMKTILPYDDEFVINVVDTNQTFIECCQMYLSRKTIQR